MITLTNPKIVGNVLGGTSTVSYNKLVVTLIHYDILNRSITGSLRLTATADAAQTPLLGSFVLKPGVSPPTLQIDLPDLPFHRIVNLTPGQASTADGFIDTVQAQIENGFVSLVAVDGTRSGGI